MFSIIDKKMLVIFGLVGLYLFYRLFLKENSTKSGIDEEYDKILNSKEYKVKGQWEE